MNRKQKIQFLKDTQAGRISHRHDLSALNTAELNELLALRVKQEKGEALTAEEADRVTVLSSKIKMIPVIP